MVSRIWHGWTTLENADTYENLLRTEIFPGIASQNVSGCREGMGSNLDLCFYCGIWDQTFIIKS